MLAAIGSAARREIAKARRRGLSYQLKSVAAAVPKAGTTETPWARVELEVLGPSILPTTVETQSDDVTDVKRCFEQMLEQQEARRDRRPRLEETSSAIDLSAYNRFDYLSAHLGQFTENGADIYDLTFAKRHLQSFSGVLGGRVAIPLSGGRARLRGEWRHEFADIDAQLRYSTQGDFWLRNAFSVDVETEIGLGRGWTLTTGIGATAGSGARIATGTVGVKKQF